MILIIATILVTIAVATAAAFFSIYGLAQIFSGALVAVIIMGASLEAGKLTATLLLHTYWSRMSVLLRSYLTVAVIVLMVITSGGVYGFLSAAYQKEQIPLQQISAKIELLDSEYTRKTDRLQQMDDIIASINPDYITKRLEEKNQQKSERQELVSRINQIESEKQKLVSRKIDTEAHIGPIIYMAEVFDKTSNDAANYLIMLLIVVFDPLAVALTISISAMLQYRKEDNDRSLPISQPKTVSIPDEPGEVVEVDASEFVYKPLECDLQGVQRPSGEYAQLKDMLRQIVDSQEEIVPIDLDEMIDKVMRDNRAMTDDQTRTLIEHIYATMNSSDQQSLIEQPEIDHKKELLRKVRENSSV